MTFVFYDTETTGLKTDFDQILQFAAIRTDDELNELERFEIRCRLLPYVVPSPGAMRVTGVSVNQLIDRSLPSHYEMMCQIRQKLLSWSPALFIGYNSREFDEHLLRQAFYKTLHPIYLTNTGGNSRTDAMRIVQASSVFAPAVLTIPTNDRGNQVFKLEQVAPANGHNHIEAHDAVADVVATIHLLRRVRTEAPDVWSGFMRFCRKAAVTDYLETETIFCLTEFYSSRPYSYIVVPFGRNSGNPSEFYALHLTEDPARLAALSDAELARRMCQSPKIVRRIRGNSSPVLVALDDAPDIAKALALGTAELERRAEMLRSDSALCERFARVYESTFSPKEVSPHFEKRIYDGFFDADGDRLAEFHDLSWEKRTPLLDSFADERLIHFGRRLVHTERPDLLTRARRSELDIATARRVLGTGEKTPWLTLADAIMEANKLITTVDAIERGLIQEHCEFLTEWMAKAERMLR